MRTSLPRRSRPMVAILKGIAAAAVAFFSTLLTLTASAAENTTPGVLFIHGNQRALPAAVIIADVLERVVRDTLGRPVYLFTEYLDQEWMTTEAHAVTQADFLRQKYSGRNIRALVVVAGALKFALKFRDRMFPGVPVVYVAVGVDELEALSLPADFIGKSIDLDPTETLRFALRLQPRAERIVIVTGAAPRDRFFEQRARRAVAQLEGHPEVEYLAGLPTAAVLQRLGALSRNTIVFTGGYVLDGDGHVSTPRQVAELVGSASAAPSYGPWDTFIDTGMVGGYMATFHDQAAQAGDLVVRLLNGTPPTAIGRSSFVNVPVVDWRALRRWEIDERLLPGNADVRFREPTMWEKYWREISIAIAVLLLQAGMIVWLLIERRRRVAAEADSRKRFAEMTHMNRRVAMGGIAASIAHELNQPLGAIQNNASAAQMLIKGSPPKLDEVAEILEDIKLDDKRASEVITRIRKMLRKSDIEVAALDLNEAIGETLKLLTFDASTHRVSVKTELEPGLAKVRADRIQIQQVLLNLALNSMEAMRDQPQATRQLTIRSRQANAKEAEISVVDSGVGIPADILPRIFDPFVTSKSGGMGVGLSISRTIVEAYGGHIRAENLPSGGAAFHFVLPLESELDKA
jgi:signal transduction histidine kinase